MGLGGALAYLPALPFMIKVSKNKFEGVPDTVLSDALSAIFGTCHYIGESFGPLYAGIMTDAIGFRYAAGLFGLILLTYSFVFGFYSNVFVDMCRCRCSEPIDEKALTE
jgi:hypothetical protein